MRYQDRSAAKKGVLNGHFKLRKFVCWTMLRTLRCVRENTGARIYLRATKKSKIQKWFFSLRRSQNWAYQRKTEGERVLKSINVQLIDFIIFVLSSDFALNKFRIVKCFKHRGLCALSIENIVLSIVLRIEVFEYWLYAIEVFEYRVLSIVLSIESWGIEVSKHGSHQIDTLAYTNILNLVTKFWWTFLLESLKTTCEILKFIF